MLKIICLSKYIHISKTNSIKKHNLLLISKGGKCIYQICHQMYVYIVHLPHTGMRVDLIY